MSNLRKALISTTAGMVTIAIAASLAIAQTAQTPATAEAAPATSAEMGPGMMTGQGAPAQGMIDAEMMRMMMQMMGMMRGQDMGESGLMGGGPGQMGRSMRGQGMMPGMPGIGGKSMMGYRGHGLRVTPSQHLTTEDVSHFLGHFLERHGNPRLEVGDVQELDEDTITAEIVTVDDSLVEVWKVDRHTGRVVTDGADQARPAN